MVSVTFFVVSVAGLLVDSAAAGGSIILERLERFLAFCVFRTGFRRCFFCGLRYVFVMVSVTFFVVSVAGFLVDSAAAGGSNILERLERFLVCFVFLGLVSVAGFFMVSVVAGKHLFYGFRRWLFMFSVVARKTFVFWFPSLVLFMVSIVARNVFVDGFRRCFVLWLLAATGPRLSLRWKP